MTTPEIKQLFCVIRLLFMIFLVLIVAPSTLAKQKKFYERSVEHAWTNNNCAFYKHLNYYTAGVQHLFNIAYLHSSLFCVIITYSKQWQISLKTARIDLVQDNTDNTEIIDRNWIKIGMFVLFKGTLKIKELNRILNSELKVSKEL